MTLWEKILFMLGFDEVVHKSRLRRAQKAQEAYLAKCEENKDGWIS